MKRKDYQMPTMQVVELQQSQQLLANSTQGDVDASMEGTFEEHDI